MAIQIEDIVNREFSREFLGYDMREVDLFLDALIDRFEKLEAQRKQMLIAMEYLLKKLEATNDLSADVKKALASGDKALRRLAAAEAEDPHGDQDTLRQNRKPMRRKTDAAKMTGLPESAIDHTESAERRSEPVVSASAAAIRPALRVGRAKPKPSGASEQSPAFQTAGGRTETGAKESAGAGADAEQAAVAIEMETHESAPDVDALIPELLKDLETALADSAIRAASSVQKDAPVRADEGLEP